MTFDGNITKAGSFMTCDGNQPHMHARKSMSARGLIDDCACA